MSDTRPRRPAEAPVMRDAGLLNSSIIMAAGTVVSRLTGFGKAAVISAAIGLTAVTADVFAVPTVIPTMLYILVGGGVLNSVLVPALVRAIKNDADGGRAYSERLFSLTVTVLGVATVAAVIAAPWIIELIANRRYLDPSMRPYFDNMVMLARFTLPQIFFSGMYVLVGQMLNAKGRFGPMMWSPILNNIVAITVFVGFIVVFGTKTNEPFTDAEVMLLGLGTTLGVAAQAICLVPVLRRTGFSLRFRTDWKGHGLGKAVELGLWTFGFVAVNQVAYLFVVKVASGASGIGLDGADGAGYAVYSNAMLILMVPHSVITVSLATALLPRLSDLASEGDLDAVRQRVVGAIRTCLAVIVPIGAMVAALAFPLTAMIFDHGAAQGQTGSLAVTLMLLMPGLVGFTVHYMALRGFYALQDTKTPFYTQIWVSAVMVVGALVVSFVSPSNRVVTMGLAIGYSTAYLVGASVGMFRLQRRIGSLGIGSLLGHIGRVAVPAGIAGTLAWLVSWGWAQVNLLGGFPAMLGRLFELAIGGTVGLAAFIGIAYAMRIAEVRQGVTMVVGKLRGRSAAQAAPAVDPGDLLEDTAEHVLPTETGTLSIFRRQTLDPEMTAEFFLDETMHGVPGFWESASPSLGDTLARPPRSSRTPEVDWNAAVVAPPPAATPDTLDVDTQPDLARSSGRRKAQPGEAIAGRYRMEQLLRDDTGVQSWRAVDDVLRRSVFLQTVPVDDPRAARYENSARTASTVGDPRFLRILDVGTDDGVFYIVREWTPGQSLATLLASGAFRPDQAAAIGREVADALTSAHAMGLAHRCLDPTLVFITSEGAVKIAGLETEAALHGPSMVITSAGTPITDSAELDAVGIGNVLYAGLTARWPTGTCGGLDPAPRIDGRLASPRQVRPGVPRILDVITDRAIGHAARHHATPLLSPSAISAELNGSRSGRANVDTYDNGPDTVDRPPALIEEPDSAQPIGRAAARIAANDKRRPARLARALGVMGGALLLVGAALVGLQLLLGAIDDRGNRQQETPADDTTSTTPAPNPEPSVLTIAGAGDLDPEGNGEENPDDVELATDGDPETAWRTVTYYSTLEAQKDGVGLYIDLGEAKPISAITLALVGEGSDVQLMVAPDTATEAPDEIDGWTSVAEIDAAGESVEQQLDEPVTSRYLLVWFTGLPSDGGDYRGGIAEVEVMG